ncbi:MAG: glycosyltransferase [Alcaligenaceae bacterium]|nr:MAG: glycosyltransferase [Alcaligenaceae bacterium]
MLTKYGRMGASSRMRSLQYLPWLKRAGLQVTVQPLLSDVVLQARYRDGRHNLMALLRAYFSRLNAMRGRHQFDVLWIEKEALPWWPLGLELALLRGVPYVLDFDDAIFHNYDQHPRPWIRKLFGRRLDGLMARAASVVGGNSYLALRAREAGTTRVELLPTVIDLERYSQRRQTSMRAGDGSPIESLPRVVWIGSPSTVHYLQLLREPLQTLAARHPFVLRVIGGGTVDLPGVQTEVVAWTEDTEVEGISACDIGIMPLKDSLWERGKCGYKLIQYMACGLPTVASGVGANPEIVRDGVCGFLANTSSEWVATLSKLLENSSLRMQMGAAGRRRVEEEYCIQRTGPRMAELLRSSSGAIAELPTLLPRS